MLNSAAWFEDPRSVQLGLALIHFLWQGALVALLAAVLLLVMRRASPQRRYAALLSVFAGMTLLPVVTLVYLHPKSLADREQLADADSAALAVPAPAKIGLFAPLGPARVAVPALRAPISASAAPSTVPATWAAQASDWTYRYIGGILAVWTIGVCLCSLRLLIGLVGASRVRRIGLRQAGEHCRRLCDELAERFQIRRTVRVCESILVRVPVVAGWISPVVLLPASLLTGLPEPQLRAILAHELAHIRRHDYLVNLLQTLVETLLFYHPAVWWLSAVLRNEREHCCDELAAEACDDRTVVARALASLAQIDAVAARPLLAANGGRLAARIRRLLLGRQATGPRIAWGSGSVLVLTLLLAAATVGLGGAPTRQQPDDRPNPAASTLVASTGGPSATGDPPAANVAAPEPPAGWQKVIDIPEVKFPGSTEVALRSSKVTLWEEAGWLIARRTDFTGGIEWQVVLARAVKPIETSPPAVKIDKTLGSLEINYDRYFVRDDLGRLRVFRERKRAGSPPWPKLTFDRPMRNFGMGSTRSAFAAGRIELKGWMVGDWFWVMSGPENRYDVWVKLQHSDLRERGNGYEGGIGNTRAFFGNAEAVDEGDLFWANRSPLENAERELKVVKTRKHLLNNPAPAIATDKWFNAPAAGSLEALHGKVVLLDFWGTWCGPCVKKLPEVERLQKIYGDRGLVAITVHSAQAATELGKFLERRPLALPIAVDTGATAKSYAVQSWPTYFLIDKSGKVAWGNSAAPPSEQKIEELLR
jgi:beta-lactamase regulating signal transducer with metallopeptidase domain/thiol-disulfide isomerase/thioredoxin